MRWNSTRPLVLPCSCSMVYELRCLGEHMWYFPRWPQYSDGWSMYWIGAMVWYNEHLSFIYSNVDGPGLALHQLLKFVAPAFLVSISFDCPLTFWYIRSCLKPAAVEGLETIALVFEHISHLLVLWRSFVCIGYERRWNSEGILCIKHSLASLNCGYGRLEHICCIQNKFRHSLQTGSG